jgi:hypothetical protein
MPYNPRIHHRRSIRFKVHDYTQPAAYFVTLCTHERAHLFGQVVDGAMQLNECGEIVRAEWFQTAVVRPYVVLNPDEFVVMPNHIHGMASFGLWGTTTAMMALTTAAMPATTGLAAIYPAMTATGAVMAATGAVMAATGPVMAATSPVAAP